MGYNSDITKSRILEHAKNEFLEHGFINSSMRKIAENANVTTGAMYNHFKNKELLFDGIVSKVANELEDIFIKQHNKCKVIDDYETNESYEMISKSTDYVIDYIYENYDYMKLIICCSQGTEYEKYIDKLIEVEEKSCIEMLLTSNISINPKDEFFIHVMASSSMYNTFECVRHDLCKEEAIHYMENIKHFYYAGWSDMIISKRL